MDPALEVEAQVDRLGRRIQVPDREGNHDHHETDADAELTTHPRRSTPCRRRPARCARWSPLEVELDLVRDLEGHGVLGQPHHGAVEPTGGDDAVALLDRPQEILALSPLLLLGRMIRKYMMANMPIISGSTDMMPPLLPPPPGDGAMAYAKSIMKIRPPGQRECRPSRAGILPHNAPETETGTRRSRLPPPLAHLPHESQVEGQVVQR